MIKKGLLLFFILIIISTTIFLIIHSTRDTNLLKEGPKPEKIIEIKNPHIVGWEKGEKVWDLKANLAWSPVGQYITYFEEITNGTLYQDKEKIIKNLTTKTVKVYRRTNLIEIVGSPTIEADFKFNDWALMKAYYLRHNPKLKRTELKNTVKIVEKDGQFRADQVVVEHDKDLATLSGNLRYTAKDKLLTAKDMTADLSAETITAKEDVYFKIDSQNHETSTEIFCQDLKFFKKSKDALMQEQLRIIQGKRKIEGKKAFYHSKNESLKILDNIKVNEPGKAVVAREVFYEDQAERLTFNGDIKAIFESGAELIAEESLKKLEKEEAQKLLKEKTILTAQKLTVNTKNKNGKASGKVRITQKDQEALADLADYNQHLEIITLTGNVYLQKKNGEWVKAKKVIASIKEKTFDAIGDVESVVKIKKK